jgi:thiamine biosynthesis lipoprotein
MGVQCKVLLWAPDAEVARGAAEAAFARIAALEDVMSDWRPHSELSRLCQARGPVAVSDDLLRALTLAVELARASDGAFDPTVGPLVQLWRAARRTGQLPPPGELADARARVGWQKVRFAASTVELTQERMALDLGGLGKGFAAQAAVDVLRARGLPRCLVALSGDVAAGDPPPERPGWRVEVAGGQAGDPAGTLWLANAALSTSGDTEQFVEIDGVRYAHIIDPRTGLGSQQRWSVTVLAPRGELADPLATAVWLLGAERGRELLGQWQGTAAVFEHRLGEGRVERSVWDPQQQLRWEGK